MASAPETAKAASAEASEIIVVPSAAPPAAPMSAAEKAAVESYPQHHLRDPEPEKYPVDSQEHDNNRKSRQKTVASAIMPAIRRVLAVEVIIHPAL